MDQEELSESVAANESPVVASRLTSSSTSLNVKVISEKAHHPEMFFPLRTFCKQKKGLFAHLGSRNILGCTIKKVGMLFSAFTVM